jgi:NADPH2:quinone reductase
MTTSYPATALQLRSLIASRGELEISLAMVDVIPPGPEDVLVRIEASPLNPSDLGLLFGAADMSTARQISGAAGPLLVADVSEAGLKAMAGRLDQSLPVGNEGAGVVVAAGDSETAQALLGKKIAMIGGAMYAQYRTIPVRDCLLLPQDATPADGASCFVNPLTALGMVETMRMEGHTALVHTAAASNVGVMLNKICLADGIGLVNIVRSKAQEAMLRELGAQYVCNSNAENFKEELIHALVATGATLAFDAIGGGRIMEQILSGMETAIGQKTAGYSRYGSTVHKQVYIYGGLETGPTIFNRSFGMAYGIGGWLVFSLLNKAGPKITARLKERVAAELKTTFSSHYLQEISLPEVLALDKIALFNKRATGEKFLINPTK